MDRAGVLRLGRQWPFTEAIPTRIGGTSKAEDLAERRNEIFYQPLIAVTPFDGIFMADTNALTDAIKFPSVPNTEHIFS